MSRAKGRSSSGMFGTDLDSALSFWEKARAEPARTTAPAKASAAARLPNRLNKFFIVQLLVCVLCQFSNGSAEKFISVSEVIDHRGFSGTFRENYKFVTVRRLPEVSLTVRELNLAAHFGRWT